MLEKNMKNTILFPWDIKILKYVYMIAPFLGLCIVAIKYRKSYYLKKADIDGDLRKVKDTRVKEISNLIL